MPDEEVNYRFIRKIEESEKKSSYLSDLSNDFYIKINNYIKILSNRLNEDSSEQKKKLLNDEIINTKKIVSNIYEIREKKIIYAAISKARGGKPDLAKMLNHEKNIFSKVYDLLLKSRNEIFQKKTNSNESSDKKVNEISKNKIENEKSKKENQILRISENIPEFIGTDTKRYNLRRNDLITLPKDMSEMLLKRNVAEKLDC